MTGGSGAAALLPEIRPTGLADRGCGLKAIDRSQTHSGVSWYQNDRTSVLTIAAAG